MRLKFLLLCVATFGFAGPIDGEYIDKYGDKVIISQRSASSFMFQFVMKGESCPDTVGTAKKMGNIWRYHNILEEYMTPLQLNFKITGNTFTVKTEDSPAYYCGRYDQLDGTYIKTKKQTFDQSKPGLTDKEYIAIKKSELEYAKADSELSKAYKKLMNSLTPQQKQELKEEQRLWIKMRDEQAFQVGPKNGNEHSYKLTELTRERVEYLNSIAK